MSKTHQRKNYKPASSAKAAELLASTGTELGSPLGFAGLEINDGPIRSMIKKLSKKDAVTRKKAVKELQEFAASCEESELTELWECWPKQYGKMILDEELRVRVGAEVVMETVSGRLGRKMEKGVLEVLPSWFLSRGDPAHEASTASERAFQTAFPSPTNRVKAAKLAIPTFYQLCSDLIFNRNPFPETKINPDIETSAQRLNRLRRTAYSALLKFCQEYCNAETKEEIENLSASLFWKKSNLWESMSSKSADNYVKAGFLKLLIWWLQTFGQSRMQGLFSRCIPVVLNHIESSEEKLQTTAWEAWLLLVDAYLPELWESVNFEKAVMPKFVAVIRRGLNGSASALSPFLLLLLSKFPSDESILGRQDRWLQALSDGELRTEDIISRLTTVVGTGKMGEAERFISGYLDCSLYCLRMRGQQQGDSARLFTQHISIPMIEAVEKLSLEKSRQCVMELFLPRAIEAIGLMRETDQEDLIGVLEESLKKIRENTSEFGTAIYGESIAVLSDSANERICAKGCGLANEILDSFLTTRDRKSLKILHTLLRKTRSKPPLCFRDREKVSESLTSMCIYAKDDEEKRLLASATIWMAGSVEILDNSVWESDELAPVLLSILEEPSQKELAEKWLGSESFERFWMNLLAKVLSDSKSKVLDQDSRILRQWGESPLQTAVMNRGTSKLPNNVQMKSLEEASGFLCRVEPREAYGRILPIEPLLSVMMTSESPELEKPIRLLTSELFILSCIVQTNECFRDLWSVGVGRSCSSEESAYELLAVIAKKRKDRGLTGASRLEAEMARAFLSSLALLDVPHNDRLIVMGSQEFLPSLDQLLELDGTIQQTGKIYMALDDAFYTDETPGDGVLVVPTEFLLSQTASQLSLWTSVLEGCSDPTKIDVAHIAWTFAYAALSSKFAPDSFSELSPLETKVVEFLRNTPNFTDALLEMCRVALETGADMPLIGIQRLVQVHLNGKAPQNLLEEISSRFGDFPPEKIVRLAALVPGDRRILMEKLGSSLDRKELLRIAFKLARMGDKEFGIEWLALLLSPGQGLLCLDRILEEIGGDTSFKTDLFSFLSQVGGEVTTLEASDRDMVLCSLVAALQEASEQEENVNLVRAAVGFFCSVAQAFQAVKEESNTSADEWNQFFLDGCAARLIPLYFSFGGKSISSESSNSISQILSAPVTLKLSQAMAHLTRANFHDLQLPTLLDPELDRKKYPAELQSLLVPLSRFLASPHSYLQVSSWSIIQLWMEKVYELEMDTDESEDEEQSGGKMRRPPSFLLKLIEDCADAVGKSLLLDDSEDEETSTEIERVRREMLGLLLSWDLLLHFFTRIAPEQRPPFAAFLRHVGLHDQFLQILLSIIPERPSPTACSTLLDPVHFLLKAEVGVEELIELSCTLYFRLVKTFPAAFRRWFTDLNQNVSKKLEKYTREYVSPHLVKQELSSLSQSRDKLGDMQLTIRSGAQEVVAVYEVEEVKMELMIKLPPNYPIDKPQISLGEKVIVDLENRRKWMLQLEIFLAKQNGSLLDGVRMWKRSVDKHLEGVEDCMICMMTVHCRSYELPGVTCKQCKKRFHASCLYKWFNSSSTNSCPLCRSGFRS